MAVTTTYKRQEDTARQAGIIGSRTPYGGMKGVSQNTSNNLGYYQQGYQAGQAVQQAQQNLQAVQARKPQGYNSKYQPMLDNILQQIQNPAEFKYEFNGDNLFKAYQDLYTQQAKQASMNAMGQAAALNGGYGSSYGQMVGQQQYQQNLIPLYEMGLNLRDRAYQTYQDKQGNLKDQYAMLQNADESGYGRYRDTVADWQREEELAANRAAQAEALDYEKYRDDLNYWTQLAQIENGAYNTEEERAEAIRQFNEQFAEQQRKTNLDEAYRRDTLGEQIRQADLDEAYRNKVFDADQWQRVADNDYRNRTFDESVRQANLDEAYRNKVFDADQWQRVADNDYRNRTFDESVRQADLDEAYRRDTLGEQIRQANMDEAYRNAVFNADQWQRNADNDYRNRTFDESVRQANLDEAYRRDTLGENVRQANMDEAYRRDTLGEQIRQANLDENYRNAVFNADQWQRAADNDYRNRTFDENVRQANLDENYRYNALNEQIRQANLDEAYRNKTFNENVRQANLDEAYRNRTFDENVRQADLDEAYRRDTLGWQVGTDVRDFVEQQRLNNMKTAASYISAILANGQMPSMELLAAAGLSEEDARKMLAQMVPTGSSSGNGGGTSTPKEQVKEALDSNKGNYTKEDFNNLANSLNSSPSMLSQVVIGRANLPSNNQQALANPTDLNSNSEFMKKYIEELMKLSVK